MHEALSAASAAPMFTIPEFFRVDGVVNEPLLRGSCDPLNEAAV